LLSVYFPHFSAETPSGQYERAAKKLIDIGVRGNAVAIAAQLLYYLTTCIWEEEGW